MNPASVPEPILDLSGALDQIEMLLENDQQLRALLADALVALERVAEVKAVCERHCGPRHLRCSLCQWAARIETASEAAQKIRKALEPTE